MNVMMKIILLHYSEDSQTLRGSSYLGEVPRLRHNLSEQVRNIACKHEMKVKSPDEVGDIYFTEV